MKSSFALVVWGFLAFGMAVTGPAQAQGWDCIVDGYPDTDCDEIPDYLDLDSDEDGIPDADEWTTPEEAFLLGIAADEASLARRNDFDQDGIWNFRDTDSDDDGIDDTDELAAGTDPYRPARHSADQDGDEQIDLSELLRVIQLYNVGGFECALELPSEDGFTPAAAPAKLTCMPHSTDYAPHDWRLSLSELLRGIQLFNSQRYHPCIAGEDGYCPGEAS